MKILAVITARGGSKGVPQKNLRSVAGKPLIEWTIDSALEVQNQLHRIVVSTDDAAIASIASREGVDVPFVRPPELSGDEIDSLLVLQHATEFIEAKDKVRMDWLLLLQPTSPLRQAEDIRAVLALATKGKCDSVISVEKVIHTHPMLLNTIEGDRLVPYGENPKERMRRQDCSPDVYVNNGAIYLSRRDVVMQQNLLLGAVARPYIMPAERSLDIDTETDLRVADVLLLQ